MDAENATGQPAELLTINQVAQLMQVDRATVYRWIANDAEWKALAHRPAGTRYRFDRAAVLELVRSRCSSSAAGTEAAA